jgi:hypothetical protein
VAEDEQVDCEADDVEEHEDGADGYVGGDCGYASWGGGGGWVRWSGHFAILCRVRNRLLDPVSYVRCKNFYRMSI